MDVSSPPLMQLLKQIPDTHLSVFLLATFISLFILSEVLRSDILNVHISIKPVPNRLVQPVLWDTSEFSDLTRVCSDGSASALQLQTLYLRICTFSPPVAVGTTDLGSSAKRCRLQYKFSKYYIWVFNVSSSRQLTGGYIKHYLMPKIIQFLKNNYSVTVQIYKTFQMQHKTSSLRK